VQTLPEITIYIEAKRLLAHHMLSLLGGKRDAKLNGLTAGERIEFFLSAKVAAGHGPCVRKRVGDCAK